MIRGDACNMHDIVRLHRCMCSALTVYKWRHIDSRSTCTTSKSTNTWTIFETTNTSRCGKPSSHRRRLQLIQLPLHYRPDSVLCAIPSTFNAMHSNWYCKTTNSMTVSDAVQVHSLQDNCIQRDSPDASDYRLSMMPVKPRYITA